ncbi:MAG: PilZ domain-containing protein [Nitrospinae bacterium]|nr:PilZ domain-containing protein [Nitrospinota bacterium]
MAKEIFYTGLRILVEIFEKKYQGVIMEFSAGESISIRLSNPDATLVHIMPDTECKVKFIAEDGMAYNIDTVLLKRKIPNIIIKYPAKTEGVSIRKHHRVSTSYWTSIMDEKNEKIGDGTIVDMSLGGCKLMTMLQYKAGNHIQLSFEYDENSSPVAFKGIIRNIKQAPYDTTYYGIEYEQPSEDFIKTIDELLKNPTA